MIGHFSGKVLVFCVRNIARHSGRPTSRRSLLDLLHDVRSWRCYENTADEVATLEMIDLAGVYAIDVRSSRKSATAVFRALTSFVAMPDPGDAMSGECLVMPIARHERAWPKGRPHTTELSP